MPFYGPPAPSAGAPYTPLAEFVVAPSAIPAANVTPATTAKARAALAGVRAGTSDFKLLCVGDSTTAGAGSGVSDWIVNSYPSQLAAMLNSTFAPAANGLAICPFPGSSLGVGADDRWTVGAGWVGYSSQVVGWGSGTSFECADADAAGPLTFAPGVECDTFTVFYTKNSLSSLYATVDLSINGGAVTTHSTQAASAGLGSVTITGTPGVNNVLTIDPVTGGRFFVVGVEARLSTRRQILVGNAGVSSSTTDHWDSDSGSTGSGPLPCIRTYAPDLSIIMLGINDSGASVSAELYKTRLRAIVNACKVSGDVILMSVVPSDGDTLITPQQAYRSRAAEVARETGSGLIDIYGRWGGFDASNAKGWMSDTKHPTALGYTDIATAVRDTFYLI